ncbi:MAG: tRNA threonylcarbamoyladenosine dehydratase [Anaerovoracaceae bacterium]
MDQNQRTIKILGKDAIDILNESRVAVFGLGGVGGSATEALVRVGVGNIDIIDKDIVDITNINRQIIATHNNIGRKKVDVMEERILSINPSCIVEKRALFFLPKEYSKKNNSTDKIDLEKDREESSKINFCKYDFVLDCVDTVTAKLELIKRCEETNTALISCMGTGNKLSPERLEIASIWNTSIDPLAKVIRKEMRDRFLKDLTVVFSKEEAIKTGDSTPGSTPFVPPAAGILMASYVTQQLINALQK